MHQYEFQYKHIVDTVNNRLKVDSTKFIYATPDRIVHVYDFEKKHLYVASPQKNMCIRYDLEDMSPPSLERRDQPLNLKYMIEDTWDQSKGLTEYLGKFRFIHYKSDNTKLSSGKYHVFRNRQTFIEPERDFKNSATGAYTFYYFNE